MKSKLVITTAICCFVLAQSCKGKQIQPSEQEPNVSPKALISLSLYLMATCPSGARALSNALNIKEKMGDALDLQIDFIGLVVKGGAVGGKIALVSPRGDTDIDTGKMLVCARQVAPDAFEKLLTCSLAEETALPGNMNSCASKLGIDSEAIEACRKDRGEELLTQSFNRSIKAKAPASPSLFVNGHQHTESLETAPLMIAICAKIEETSRPAVCESTPAPTPIQVTVLTDKRCSKCDVNTTLSRIRSRLPGIQSRTLDWETPEAKKLFEELKLNRLPVFLFEKNIENIEDQSSIGQWLEPAGEYYKSKLPGIFDPKAEICDNGIDDTGDGHVDCESSACKPVPACRIEIKEKLQLFYTPGSRSNIRAAIAIQPLLKTDKEKMGFTLNVLTSDGTNKDVSPATLNESKRIACAVEVSEGTRNFMQYIWCNSNGSEKNWRDCADKAGLNSDKIAKCITGTRAQELLVRDAALAADIGVEHTPSWFLNNKQVFHTLDSKTLNKTFCSMNAEFQGCR